MIQIREGVFETNSSSTHSIAIATKHEYDMWRRDEMAYDDWNGDLIPLDETSPEDFYGEDGDDRYYKYEDFPPRDFEEFYLPFKTPSGEEMVTFGYYGYDG